MDKHLLEFIRIFTEAVEKNNAAIFAGAGLSKPAGFVNWKELLKEIAEDIGLDIDKETDLISVAQYHVNENGGNRGKLNQVLIDEFTKETSITNNHAILSHMPISTYWTTNYDSLIEDSLKSEGKRVDVKRAPSNLAYTVPNCDATIYKMHGDISSPDEAVLTKDDYEGYNTKRQMYTTVLQGDLVSKTFLFIGFSFDDPNLEYILSRIRLLLGNNQRPHYCFMKKVSRSDFLLEEDFTYGVVKQNLKINDLKRFNIKVLLVEDYQVITDVLEIIENNFKRKNIFVSGSAAEYGSWGETTAFQFSSNLSKKLIENGNNITTGFGLGVGSCIISGALEQIYHNNNKAEERLIARPFPQQGTETSSINDIWTKYRIDMLSNVGIAIFLFGNKVDSETGKLVDANGMEEEFNLCIEKGVIPIPVGATEYIARKLWINVMENFDKYINNESLREYYTLIGEISLEGTVVIDAVINIINGLNRRRER